MGKEYPRSKVIGQIYKKYNDGKGGRQLTANFWRVLDKVMRDDKVKSLAQADKIIAKLGKGKRMYRKRRYDG